MQEKIAPAKTAQTNTKARPLQNIMRKYAKVEHIQKRQSALLMTYASGDHKTISLLLKKWLNEAK